MQQAIYNYLSSRISYRFSAPGNTPVFCFHGYGETAESFDFLEAVAGPAYSLIAIDLPAHGKTMYNEPGLTVTDIAAVCTGILQEIMPGATDRKWILAGYSLGGRVALSLYQQMPGKVDKLVLLAPDGLRMNPWYWLATQTHWGNRFFAFTMKKPEWFSGLLKGLYNMGLLNASIFKFVRYYIGDPDVRNLLYTRWTLLRRLKPNLKKIRQLAVEKQTAFRLIYGRHDRIIRPGKGQQFIRGLENQARLRIIQSGHQVLQEKHVQEILNALQH